jgi:hypothetical protein
VTRPAAWIRWVTWIAILAPLPYTVSRVLWAMGIPLGIDADVLHNELHAPGLGSLFILLLGVAAELTALWTRTYLLLRPSRHPRWLPILRHRPVRPGVVIAPLLIPILILAGANAMSAPWIANGFERSADTESNVADWAVSVAAVEFWIWGVSLTIATAAYWLAARTTPISGMESRTAARDAAPHRAT